MSYREWFEEHGKKHRKIVEKLLQQGYDEDAIIDYFDWQNLSQAEPDFCPLFAEGKQCHEMAHLNCYLCACPHFRFDDDALRVKSRCSIDSPDGQQAEFGGVEHRDCSGCIVPHRRSYIKKHFDTDWFAIMQGCDAQRKK